MRGDCGVRIGAIHTDSFGYVGTGDDASSVTALVSSGAVRTVSACIGNGAASGRMSIARDKAKGREKKKIEPPRALSHRGRTAVGWRSAGAQLRISSAVPYRPTMQHHTRHLLPHVPGNETGCLVGFLCVIG